MSRSEDWCTPAAVTLGLLQNNEPRAGDGAGFVCSNDWRCQGFAGAGVAGAASGNTAITSTSRTASGM